MSDTAPETRLEPQHAQQKPRVRCRACPTIFEQNRPHQKFCSTKCKNDYHGKMTPESLRRDLDALRLRFEELQATLAQVNADAARRDQELAAT